MYPRDVSSALKLAGILLVVIILMQILSCTFKPNVPMGDVLMDREAAIVILEDLCQDLGTIMEVLTTFEVAFEDSGFPLMQDILSMLLEEGEVTKTFKAALTINENQLRNAHGFLKDDVETLMANAKFLQHDLEINDLNLLVPSTLSSFKQFSKDLKTGLVKHPGGMRISALGIKKIMLKYLTKLSKPVRTDIRTRIKNLEKQLKAPWIKLEKARVRYKVSNERATAALEAIIRRD